MDVIKYWWSLFWNILKFSPWSTFPAKNGESFSIFRDITWRTIELRFQFAKDKFYLFNCKRSLRISFAFLNNGLPWRITTTIKRVQPFHFKCFFVKREVILILVQSYMGKKWFSYSNRNLVQKNDLSTFKMRGGNSQNFLRKFLIFFLTLGLKILRL